LGQFRLVIEDQPITETKAQRKPLNLLEVLIAMGGVDVKVERIAEVLWPDAEGDAAVSAFTTTVSRLRKLIGSEAITIKSSRISLDRKRCWVDVAALEHQLDKSAPMDSDPAAMGVLAEQVLALYKGPFLFDEEGEWALPLRDRLRMKLSRFLAQCTMVLNDVGEAERAAGIVARAVSLDPGIERFLQERSIN